MTEPADKPKEKRRGHGDGTFYQRADGTWVGQIRLGWEEGKRKRVTRYGKTRKEVKDAIDEVKRKHSQGIVAPGQRMTVEAFLDLWLENSVAHSVRPRTKQSYADVCRLYIVPAIGKKQLHSLTVTDVQRMIATRIEKGLSPRTAQYAHSVLRKALNQAMSWDLVSRNVAALAKAPRVEQHEAIALLPEEAQRFIEAARTHRLQSLFVIAIALGLREGEVLGLSWSDIDFERGTLTVRHSLQKIDGEYVLAEPKTKRSRRTLLLPPILVDELRGHRQRQRVERIAAGPVWHDRNLVFTTAIGTPIDRRNLLRIHYETLGRAGLPRMPFHDLRHTAASLLFAMGLDAKVIQEMLGHSTIGVTMDIYAKVLPSVHERTAEVIAAIVQPATKTDAEKA